MTVAVRFAPSPSGLLHIGNVRTALVTWLYARKSGGRFVLRLDDTERGPDSDQFATAIERDLAWLGLDWNDKARQSDRMATYAEAIAGLQRDGRVYPCYETPEELALKRKTQLQRHLPPIYDRAALTLDAAQREAFEREGRRPHWRFRLDREAITWVDLVRGPVHFHGKDISDPVVIRANGSPLYHLCSVVDDLAFGITHVVRGEDHVTNTAAHVQMFRALGAEPPAFAHLPLVADVGGKSLSKRLGSLSVAELRDEEDLEAMAIISLLARLGTADPIEPFSDIGPLIEGFDFGKFARAAPKFNLDDLVRLNAQIVHDTPYRAVAGRLEARGLTDIDEKFWLAVRANLTRVRDVDQWWQVVAGPIEPVVRDPEFAGTAAELLPPEPWGEETWRSWTDMVKQRTGLKGKGLFLPLRLALTGLDHGPELKTLLPLIGRKAVLARLKGEAC